MSLCSLRRWFPHANNVWRRQLSSSAAVSAGRQGGRFRKAEKKYSLESMGEFKFDDQTTIGHELFENIREVRKYLRKSKYELPKLSEFAKPFDPPSNTEILRFQSHRYLGEGHPVERKVVMSVKVSNLGLGDVEKHKFLLLSGPRYRVDTDELVMSCEKFPHRNQNKKFLSDTLDKLVAEAKNPNDTFADIPLDLPQPKKKLEFPKEWARPPL